MATLKRWEQQAAAATKEHRGWTNVGLMSTKSGIPFLRVDPHSHFESPTMVCYKCHRQFARENLVAHFEEAHDYDGAMPIIVDNVKDFQNARCFVPIGGWPHPLDRPST